MTFHWPYALIALPLALAGVLVLFKTSRRARERLLGHFAAQRLLPMLLASYSPALRRLKQGLLLAGVLLTVLALARPQWGYDWEQRQSRGVDVIFVIDTSKSMMAQDVQPSRLERAKLAILDSVEKMGGNRVGLVAFAGDAFLLCPLTLDYDAFRQTLEAVDVNTIARGGTDIGTGLDEAAAALEKSGNHKIIVLLTDGEDLEGEGVNEAKALADQNVTIYTVGVGTPQGEIIPVRDATGGTDFVRDQRGQIVKSHLDADTLTNIAQATHGFYQPLGALGEGLTKVYEEGIKKIPEQNLTAQMQRLPIERYQWPLALGTLLLTMEILIGTRRPSWRRTNPATVNLAEPLPVSSARRGPPKQSAPNKPPVIAAVLMLGLFLSVVARSYAADGPPPDNAAATGSAQPAAITDSSTPPIQSAPMAEPAATAQTGTAANTQQYSAKDAQSLFQKGDYLGAAQAYGQAADANPQDGRFRYDQGESLYRGGNFDAAADAFSKTLSSNDLQLQQRSYYNLGNTHYRLGQADLQQDPKKTQASWEQAVKDYQNALELNSSDADAHYNLGVVKQEIEELKKQMEQQKQQQQNQQDQDKQQQDQQNQQQNQSQQNQSQQNQQQNQSGQQNSSQQNQSQNQSGQQSQSTSDNNQGQQNSSGSQNQPQNGQNPSQQQSGQQKSPNSPNQQSPGQNGQQKQPGDQNKTGNQPNQPGQKPGDQNQNGAQKQAAANPQGTEPGQQNAGQSKAAAAGGASTSGDNSGDASANGTVVAGAMTRDEAHQLLDSLKSNEHKLPVTNLQNSNAKPSTDQYFKDW